MFGLPMGELTLCRPPDLITYTFFKTIFERILKEIPQEVLSDGECC